MAVLADKGTYVKLEVNVWIDKKSDLIHITSNDHDLPVNGMHMTAKRGTQSDTNLRAMLDKMLVKPEDTTGTFAFCAHCGGQFDEPSTNYVHEDCAKGHRTYA